MNSQTTNTHSASSRNAKLKFLKAHPKKHEDGRATLVFKEIANGRMIHVGIFRTFRFTDPDFKRFFQGFISKVDPAILNDQEILEKLRSKTGSIFEALIGNETENPRYTDIIDFLRIL